MANDWEAKYNELDNNLAASISGYIERNTELHGLNIHLSKENGEYWVEIERLSLDIENRKLIYDDLIEKYWKLEQDRNELKNMLTVGRKTVNDQANELIRLRKIISSDKIYLDQKISEANEARRLVYKYEDKYGILND